MKLSIVATLYQSAAYIPEFHRRASEVAQKYAGDDYEIILVNDGSPDNSLEVAVELTKADSHLSVVDLSRNFGHHKAMMTGLEQAQGEQIFLIDSDLEEEPEWLFSFAEQMNASQCDVIYGTQKQRKGNLLERVSGKLFYKIFRALTQVSQPNNITTARLMSRHYARALTLHKEREVNIGGLWVITGFHQESQQVTKHSTSPTTYSVIKKLSHLINAITSFSSTPLVFTFYIGLTISAASGLYVIKLLLNYLFMSSPLDGYTSLIASIWLLSGLIILFLGVQGIYLSLIHI